VKTDTKSVNHLWFIVEWFSCARQKKAVF